MDAAAKRRHAERVRRTVTKLVQVHGFVRGKPTFWARPREHVVEFIHLHLFRFGPKFRAHCGIRVLNDSFEAIALNGPTSDEYWSGASRIYDLSFEVDTSSVARCAVAIDTFRLEVAELWFQQFADVEKLLASTSPLKERERSGLELSYRGESKPAAVALSRELLGVA